MQILIHQIDELLARRSLLQHPFYLLWSEGKLTKEALAGYAKEYYQLVKAVPTCVASIAEHAPESAEKGLRANQAEEQEHVPLWESFAGALGIPNDDLATYAGLPTTQKAVAHMNALCRSYVGGAAAMYAFEKALPAISTTKLEGLKAFYQMEQKEATTYFEVHAVVDVVHAQYWAHVLDKQPESTTTHLYEQAEESLNAQHELLDGCCQAYCHDSH